jgi:8-oxo-dGTP diphosphatase
VAPLYVVRHAHAGSRGQADGPDDLRPLSERGWRQAHALVEVLAEAGVTRLVSSPYVRCMQTLEPLAAALGLAVQADDRLAEGSGFEPALALAEELSEAPAVVCSHGDVIPDLLEALVRRGMELQDPARWPKGSTWVLTRDDEGFVKARYLPPPL